jgi:DNA-binding NtrC family response regulator
MAGAEQVLARGVMPSEISLLIVDDDRNSRECCKSVAENLGFTVFSAEDAAGLLRHLAIHKTDLVLLESRVAGPEPHSLLRSIRQIYLHTEVIKMSGQTTVESVLTAMKTGATD